jgi:hypothetical protein
MLTLDFDTKNGNRVYVMEQPTPLQQVIIGITVILSFLVLAGLMKYSVKFGPWIGQYINHVFAVILGILIPLIALIVGILIVAGAFQFVRFKILTCYGFFTIQKDRILEIHKKWNTNVEKEVELKTYSYVNSMSIPGGYQIELSTSNGEKLNILSLLAPYNNVTPLSQDAKTPKTIGSGRHSHIKRPKPYPTDELFASWLEIDLMRGGQKVDFNRSVHIF